MLISRGVFENFVLQCAAMKMILLFLAIILPTNFVFAQDRPADTVVLRDAKEYSDHLERIGKLKIDDQVDAWQTFLSDHPNQSFRKEIEKNIERLESLSSKKNDKKHGDERDAELYLKAIEYAKKLNPADQILLWQQFLDENPTNIYRNEAQTRLTKLRRTVPKVQTVPKPTSQLSPQPSSSPPATIASKASLTEPKKEKTNVGGIRPIKDRDQAIFLAWLPGLVVPSMGHWYTEDYLIAGVLTAIRIGGFAVGIPGIINRDNEKIYIGTGLAVLSYAIDIADAPYSADRYNESHKIAYLQAEEQQGKSIALFSHSFTF